jgi:hypothetical protein
VPQVELPFEVAERAPGTAYLLPDKLEKTKAARIVLSHDVGIVFPKSSEMKFLCKAILVLVGKTGAAVVKSVALRWESPPGIRDYSPLERSVVDGA